MIETAMFVAAGFLAASLLALILAPVQWRRAVRLTEQRVRSLTPLSMAEIQADKDRLRAEHAQQLRRVENALEKLKEDNALRRAEIFRTSEMAKLRAAEALTGAQTISDLEEEIGELRQNLIHAESSAKNNLSALKKAQRRFSDQSKELEQAREEAREASLMCDEQKVKIAALQTEIASGEEQIRDISKATKGEPDDTQKMLAEMTEKLHEARLRDGEVARMKTENERLRGELGLVRAELSAQALEIEALRREKAVRERAAEKQKARLEAGEGAPVAELELEGFAERDAQAGAQDAPMEEKQRLVAEVEALRGELAESRERDRVENEALRERLADVAAKVAHMSAALEGGDTVIEEILRNSAPAKRRGAGKSRRAKARQANAGAEDGSGAAETPPAPTTLADRIRALQKGNSAQA
jgi:DNA repair exonuclease SbcCD ATPase subunit